MTERDPEKIIEDGVAEIYRGLFRLRKAQKYQEEYDAMGSIVSMLTTDRMHLRKTYKVTD